MFYNIIGNELPLIPPVTQTVWGWEGGRGCWVVFETIFCRSLKLHIWPDSQPAKLPYHPKPKPRRVGGLRQINSCRKVPLQVTFLDNDIWTYGIAFCQFNLSTERGDRYSQPRTRKTWQSLLTNPFRKASRDQTSFCIVYYIKKVANMVEHCPAPNSQSQTGNTL